MANFSVNLTDDQKDEIVVNVLLKDLFSFEGKIQYPNPDDIKVQDAIKTILSNWYMTPEAYEKVMDLVKEEPEVKESDEKFYWIEPLNGWKWGFPKKINYNSYIGDTIDWLIKNGYPKEEIEKIGKNFSWKIWRQSEEKKEQKK